jgi:hypothetical protein
MADTPPHDVIPQQVAASPQTAGSPQTALSALFADGERLGWTFRDRNLFKQPYPEPRPVLTPVPAPIVTRATTAQSKQTARMLIVAAIGAGFALIIGCCGGVTHMMHGSLGGVLLVCAGLVLAATAAGVTLIGWTAANAKSEVDRAQHDNQARYQQECAVWDLQRARHDAAEQARVDVLAEWGSADPPPGTRRVDIVGGTTWGWEALLTVFGGSLLRSRGALTLVDFTGEAACRELVALAEQTGTSVDVKFLPSQLAETNILSELEPRQLVDVLIESMYGDAQGPDRADRAQDDRILTGVCEVLGDDVTLARIAASMRVLMGESGTHDVLTDRERDRIADDLFADEFKRQVHPNLRRIESYIHPIEALGSRATGTLSATLTCLVDESDGRNVRRELLKDLTIQWLIHRVSARNLQTRSLIIVGADEVGHLHIERLTDLCERRDIRLVLLFRHLRGSAIQAIGGGTVGFMRLANHEEARQGAEFIGHQHTFKLSQLTRTLGGSDTHSVADSQGRASQRTSGWMPGRHDTRSVTRNWSQTVGHADGSNWSDAASAQRVYEYAVEPRTLQDLPDYALLLVKEQAGGSILQPVECNPEIVLLPRMIMQPLPDIPAISGTPTRANPTWPASSKIGDLGSSTM